MLLEFELRNEAFLDYIDGVKYSFNAMIETMKTIADKIVMKKTQMRTPIDTGKLSRSFRWKVVTDNSRMKVLQVQMSALNERTGYDYAWIQHENFSYKHESKELGFVNYRKSYFRDGGYDTTWSNIDLWDHHKGEAKYLEWGIIDSRRDAFVMLERDYLSLFEYGGIF